MAGIGFRLRGMAARKTFGEWLKSYTYSVVIYSGPWLISIAALAALSIFTLPSMQQQDVRLFTVIIVYAYCFSLVTTGILQLVVTRYVSDQLYQFNPDAVVPAFVGSIALTGLVQTVSGAVFLFFADLELPFKVAALGIYVTVSLVWVEMVFLSAAKDYAHVVLAFALGYLTSFLAAQFLGAIYQLNGLVFGFLIGQVLLSALLVQRIFADYRFGQGFNFNFLGHFRTYPTLALIGFTYNLAIWIDKVIMWYSPSGTRIHSVFYTHFPYDSAMFLAYMSIIPTLAVFLLRIETDFFVRYKNYYGSIKARAPLDVIEARRREMTDVLGSALYTVLIYQGTVTAIALLAMPYIVSIIGVDPVYAPVFRVGVVGAFFHAGVLIIMILLLYFDFRGAGLVLTTVFLLTNSVFTALTTGMPQWTMGYGYTCSTMLTLGLGVLLLSNRLKRLEYLTFMRQPIR